MAILKELTANQISALLPYQQRLIAPGGGSYDISTSKDGALTIEKAGEIFPGSATAHLWYLEGKFVLDVVVPGGKVTSISV